MELVLETRSHGLDGIAKAFGTRLITLDVLVKASPEEAAKLKSFNMLKREFFSAPETKSGVLGLTVGTLSGAAAYLAWGLVDSASVPVTCAGLSGLSLYSSWSAMGKESVASVKVRDVIKPPGVPFTRDNPAEIHEIAEAVTEQYQVLFGAMFEIEYFGIKREAQWQNQGALA